MIKRILLALCLVAVPLAVLLAQQPVDQTKVNGTAVATGNGVTGTGVQRVNEATDSDLSIAIAAIQTNTGNTASDLSTLVGNLAVDAVHDNAAVSGGPQAMLEYNTGPVAVTSGDAVRAQGSSKGEAFAVVRDAAGNGRGANVNASNELLTTLSALPALAAGTAYVGKMRATDGTNDAVLDPCETVAQTATPLNISTATTTQIVAADTGKKIYVCGLTLFTAAANNVALVEDLDAACASPAAGMAGGTTAASGFNFVANQGFVWPAGKIAHAQTAAASSYVCLITSAATQLSGVMKWVAK